MTVEHLEVHVWNGQSGVYAARDFEPGDKVMEVLGDVGTAPTRYSIQISADRHVHPDGPETPWKFLNHACRPNLALDPESRHFVALEVVKPGTQLTFNYLTTEWEMAEAFECECGDEKCFGIIAGFSRLDESSRERIYEDVMPHIRTLSESYRMENQRGAQV